MKRLLIARPDLTAPMAAIVAFLLAIAGVLACAMLLVFGMGTLCWFGWAAAAFLASFAALSASLRSSRLAARRPSVAGLVLGSVAFAAWAAWCMFGSQPLMGVALFALGVGCSFTIYAGVRRVLGRVRSREWPGLALRYKAFVLGFGVLCVLAGIFGLVVVVAALYGGRP